MERTLEPELLDALSPTDPDAIRSRRDLRLTNRTMGNHQWVSRTVARLVRAGERVLEVGAGEGELARRLHRQGVAVDALDLWPEPAGWPKDRRWHQANLRTFDRWADYAVIYGNLIFHHFSDAELRELGTRLRDARVIVACEPTRSRISQFTYALIAPCFGANQITLHDAHVSIGAGFQEGELPRTLGLVSSAWSIQCRTTWMGAYHLVATRQT